MNTILKISFVTASLLAAYAAQAVTLDLNLQSNGSYTQSGSTVSVVEHVTLQDIVNDLDYSTVTMPSLTGLTYSFNASTGLGSGLFTNGTDSLSFNFAFQPVPSLDPASQSVSGSATWTLTNATGAFAPYTLGSGTLSATYSPKIRKTSLTNFSGQIQSVPEPASMAAVGIGVAGLLRRRKKA